MTSSALAVELIAIHADGTDVEAVRNAVTHTVRTLGRLDVLVNNTGYANSDYRRLLVGRL
jgi:NAD(P)-dependent dehydrogenase (short-subunit alcohol dehydrogenase family)